MTALDAPAWTTVVPLRRPACPSAVSPRCVGGEQVAVFRTFDGIAATPSATSDPFSGATCCRAASSAPRRRRRPWRPRCTSRCSTSHRAVASTTDGGGADVRRVRRIDGSVEVTVGPSVTDRAAGRDRPLAGFTVGITAARRARSSALRWNGAAPRCMYAPAIRIVPLADDTELRAATQRCLAAPLDVVVATTGIGFRGWMEAAETWGLAEPTARRARPRAMLCPRPEGTGAVRAAGLREALVAGVGVDDRGARAPARTASSHGRRIAVQLHGEPLPGSSTRCAPPAPTSSRCRSTAPNSPTTQHR